jgi:hypothetical protein
METNESRPVRPLTRPDGSLTHLGKVVEEYVWLHEFCGVHEEQVARQLGMSHRCLVESLRRSGHPRPPATIEAADSVRRALNPNRARLGR